MAERKPSKQRRQAQNRAAREARSARSAAANTPVEERRVEDPEPDRKSRRRRGRRDDPEVRARAREVIEASADETDVDDEIDEIDEIDEVSEEPAPAPAAPTRRSASPVFSARHRAEVAAATAHKAPARTHAGVGAAAGVEVDPPSQPVSTASGTDSERTSRSSSRTSSAGAASTRSGSSSGTKQTAKRPAQSATRPAQSAKRPPARPLPPWLDRFGGNEPGGRWVMLSFLTILLASIVLNFVHIVPEMVKNAEGDQVQTGRQFTIWHYGIGPGLYFLLPPILILGLFILTARPSNRRRSWNMALMCLVFITFVTSSIAIYIIPIACLGWGCWQARKAALEEVGGDPRVLREVERERRIAEREALRERRQARAKR